MRKIDTITDFYPDEEFLQADGFDNAIIGVVTDFNSEPRLAYSKALCISNLVNQGMSYEEAVEYFDYNVAGAYVGKKTPIWVDDEMSI